jgi:hypothetical protein
MSYCPLVLLAASNSDASKTGSLIPIFMKCKSFVHFCKIMKTDLRYLCGYYTMGDLRKMISSIQTVHDNISRPNKSQYSELDCYQGEGYNGDWETLLEKCQGSLLNTIESGYSYSQINCIYDKKTLMKNLEGFVNKIKKYNSTANMNTTFLLDFDNDNIINNGDELGKIFENEFWDEIINDNSSSSDNNDISSSSDSSHEDTKKSSKGKISSGEEDKKIKPNKFSKIKKSKKLSSSSSSYEDRSFTKKKSKSKTSKIDHKKEAHSSSSSGGDAKKEDPLFSSSSNDDVYHKNKGILKNKQNIPNKLSMPVQNPTQLKSITGVDVKKLQKFSKYRAYAEYRIFIQQKLSELSMIHPEISALELYTRADMEWLRKYSN